MGGYDMTKEERQKTKNNFLSILKVFDGNLQKTCKAINVSRPTVYTWLKSDENFKNKYDKIKDYYKTAFEDLGIEKKSKVIYPYNKMEVGDSFLIPCHIVDVNAWRGRFSISARRYRQKNNCLHKRFASRVVEGGLRIWRLK